MRKAAFGISGLVLAILLGGTGYLFWHQNSLLADMLDRMGSLETRIDTLASATDALGQQISDLPASSPAVTVTPTPVAETTIGLLAEANKKSRDSRRKADLSELRTAFELYYDDNLRYPTAASYEALSALVTPTYIRTLPLDPVNTGNMVYSYSGDAQSYTLTAYLEATGAMYTVNSAN